MDYEFYETPETFTNYLFDRVPIVGRVCEPYVGSGAIVRASPNAKYGIDRSWWTNDLDPRWGADAHVDATRPDIWRNHAFDWTISNPPFSPAIDIIAHALAGSRVGVAMHLRASIHEVLKTGIRRTFMSAHKPTGILWLPRFAYQRSKTTGKWTTDSVCACWVIWLQDATEPQFIDYAPESVIDALGRETRIYRKRMDDLMGYTGSEEHRQGQRKLAA